MANMADVVQTILKDFIKPGLKVVGDILSVGFKSVYTVPKAFFNGGGVAFRNIGAGFGYIGNHRVGTSVVIGTVLTTVGLGTWAKEHKLANQEAEMNNLQAKIAVRQQQIAGSTLSRAQAMSGFDNTDVRTDHVAGLQAARDVAQQAATTAPAR